MKSTYASLKPLFILISIVITSNATAEVKRVIDQGMIDGERKYIIACTSGQQMIFSKKFTAPIIEESIGLGEPGESSSSSTYEPPKYIQSCLQTRDERGAICRADEGWSARSAAEEFCN